MFIIMIIFCLQVGGGGLPPSPDFLKTIHACRNKAASRHQHVCSRGWLCISYCFQMGGAFASPNPTALFQGRPRMLSIMFHELASCFSNFHAFAFSNNFHPSSAVFITFHHCSSCFMIFMMSHQFPRHVSSYFIIFSIFIMFHQIISSYAIIFHFIFFIFCIFFIIFRIFRIFR